MTSLRKLGTSDLEVFPLSLGGNVFGWTADEAASFAVLDAYTAAGGNFVDTADSYSAWVEGNSGGESETIIGKWVKARGNRSDVVIATKVSQHPEYQGLSAANIKAAADASLRRLGTDYIDLYYTHFDKPDVPVEEIIGALDELVRAGKVRYIAASNISPERLEESLSHSERAGRAARPCGLHGQRRGHDRRAVARRGRTGGDVRRTPAAQLLQQLLLACEVGPRPSAAPPVP
ncbi:hypothetical protein SALBM311S_02774 [Streptomyces alboniger]